MDEVNDKKAKNDSKAHASTEEESISTSQEKFPKQNEVSPDDIVLLEKKVELLTNENKDLREKNLRAYADLENYKKRIAKEREEFLKYRNEELIQHLLPIIDHLEMALYHTSSVSGEQEKNAIKQGVELIFKDLISTLKKFNLEAIQAVGQPFDPLIHHAMTQIETLDQPDNTVVSEFRKGYKLNDKVLRPSLVAVSKKPEKEELDNKIEDEKEEE